MRVITAIICANVAGSLITIGVGGILSDATIIPATGFVLLGGIVNIVVASLFNQPQWHNLRPLLPALIGWASSLLALWIGVLILWMIENGR